MIYYCLLINRLNGQKSPLKSNILPLFLRDYLFFFLKFNIKFIQQKFEN